MLCKLTHVTNLSISCTHTCPCTAATAACFQCIKRRTSCPHSLSPSHRAMLGLPRDCISLLLSLLGVAGAPALVLTAPASVALQDVECVRAAYVAAARAFTIPWQLRALVKAARATPCLPAAYLRLCRAVFAIVRLCFRPVCAPGVSLAYPCFADAAPACLQLSGPRSRRSAFAALFVTLGFPPPPPEDSHNLHCDLLLAGLPANPHVAWLRLNRGSWWFPVRRILQLLRLGTHTLHFYHRAPEVDRPPAFVITFSVLGVSGCFVALEPDTAVAGFLLP